MLSDNVKLYTPGGGRIDSLELSADFRSADKFGPYRVGKQAFFYRSGLRQYCLPFSDFGHVFKRAMLCAARHCGNRPPVATTCLGTWSTRDLPSR